MKAFLLEDIEFEDLVGISKILKKGDFVIVDDFDDKLIIIEDGELEYIVKVNRTDYRKFREMN